MEKPLLPVVSKDTCTPIVKELKREQDNQYVTKIVEHLAKENPKISNFIGLYAVKTKDPVAVIRCAALVYKLLESQAEADRLGENPSLKW